MSEFSIRDMCHVNTNRDADTFVGAFGGLFVKLKGLAGLKFYAFVFKCADSYLGAFSIKEYCHVFATLCGCFVDIFNVLFNNVINPVRHVDSGNVHTCHNHFFQGFFVRASRT